MNTNLALSPEISRALQQHMPVVALESTLITHGLPYPTNRETALNMEQAVRDNGAVPATIGIINGSIRVGMTKQEIETLAQAPAGTVRKCSRRDLPIAVGLRENATTTVAGTMIVAHMAGIQVFATGGIGGVHRGHPFDVSADLIELGRTPVTVVCSGAKSLLDLPLTVEVLETQGVPVVGLGTDTLPAFYSRTSGLGVDVRVKSPHEAAQIIRASHVLEARHGILVVVPVPAEQAFDPNEAEAAIAQATREADEQNVQGKLVTPFVLNRLAEITGGKAMTANRALLVNNARIAAQIAVALSSSQPP